MNKLQLSNDQHNFVQHQDVIYMRAKKRELKRGKKDSLRYCIEYIKGYKSPRTLIITLIYIYIYINIHPTHDRLNLYVYMNENVSKAHIDSSYRYINNIQ